MAKTIPQLLWLLVLLPCSIHAQAQEMSALSKDFLVNPGGVGCLRSHALYPTGCAHAISSRKMISAARFKFYLFHLEFFNIF